MRTVRFLLLALAVWMPASSFVSAVAAHSCAEASTPCDLPSAPGEAAEQSQENEALVTFSTLLATPELEQPLELAGHSSSYAHHPDPLQRPPNA